MVKWKCLPGIFYQTEGDGKRARQRRAKESVCVRGRALQKEGDGVGNKIDRYRKTYGANVRLISERIKNVANDVVPTICIFSLLIYKQHLDLMTSHKSLITIICELAK